MTIQKTYNNATIKKVLRYTDKNDIEGNPQYALMYEKVNCRKLKTEKLVHGATGDEIKLNYEVWLAPEYDLIPVNSKIVFVNNETGIVVDSHYVSGLIAPQFQKVLLK